MARFTHEHSEIPPDTTTIVNLLDQFGVRYVLVGGMAMVLHGTNHVTVDSDFAVAPDAENRTAIAKALESLSPEPSHLPRGTRVVWDERSISGSNVSLRTTAGDLDLMLATPGVEDFEALYGRSQIVRLESCTIRVASVEDLILMKRTASRPKDLAHVAELEAYVRENQE